MRSASTKRVLVLVFLVLALGCLAGWLLVGCGAQFSDAPRFAFVRTGGSGTGSIQSFLVLRSSGLLSPLASSATTGAAPRFITSDLHGRLLYVANNASNTISAYGVDRTTANIFVAPGSPFATGGANPVKLAIDAKTQFLFAANNGSSNVSVFKLNRTNGSLTSVSGSPFTAPAAPSGLAVAPSGNFLYVALGTGGIAVFNVSPAGALSLASQQPGSATAGPVDLVVTPNGKFLYAVDGQNAVLAYGIDPASGALSLIGSIAAGSQPVSVAVDPLGRYVYTANLGSGDVSAYSIGSSGAPAAISGSPFAAGPQPLQVVVDPSSRFVYTANSGGQNVSVLAISSTGALAAIGSANTASTPRSLVITR